MALWAWDAHAAMHGSLMMLGSLDHAEAQKRDATSICVYSGGTRTCRHLRPSLQLVERLLLAPAQSRLGDHINSLFAKIRCNRENSACGGVNPRHEAACLLSCTPVCHPRTCKVEGYGKPDTQAFSCATFSPFATVRQCSHSFATAACAPWPCTVAYAHDMIM